MKLPASKSTEFSSSFGDCVGSWSFLMMTAGPGTAVTASLDEIPALRSSPRMTPATPSGSTIMLFWMADGGSGA